MSLFKFTLSLFGTFFCPYLKRLQVGNSDTQYKKVIISMKCSHTHPFLLSPYVLLVSHSTNGLATLRAK